MTSAPRVPRRVRFEVLRRDDHTCRYCGSSAPSVVLTVDHVIPRVLGGADTPDNLVAACEDCNGGKTSTTPGEPLVAQVKSDAVRWAKAMETAVAERKSDRVARDEALAWFRQRWEQWYRPGPGSHRSRIPLPDDWSNSVEAFATAGVDRDELEELINVAMGSKADDTFRYFCGCAWNVVRNLQQRAQEIASGSERPLDRHEDDPQWMYDAGWHDALVSVPSPAEAYDNGWNDAWAAARSAIERSTNDRDVDDAQLLSQILHQATSPTALTTDKSRTI